jgi:hypothetical protein
MEDLDRGKKIYQARRSEPGRGARDGRFDADRFAVIIGQR